MTLYDYCMEYGRFALLQQWHPIKNGELRPKDVSYGSKKKIWWQCEKGHEWQAIVCSRVGKHAGCPYCAGVRVYPGENDLASRRPDLAAQWHPTRNGEVTPSEVSIGSHHVVWWICEKGHVWRAMVKSRTSGVGCPVCSNRALFLGENDLATTYPNLASQWHPEKNKGLTPQNVVPGTARKVWWKCEKGHEWQATVSSRVAGTGCPVCSGKRVVSGENDLEVYFPEIAAQWHPTKNDSLAPDKVTPCSNRKVWWLCGLGHAYQATISSRTMRGSGCPYCAGKKVLTGFNDLATKEPSVAKEWHSAFNGTLRPEDVTVGSHRKVWWQCAEGHVWKAAIYSRACGRKCGCPVCAGRCSVSRAARYAIFEESLSGSATN